MQRTWATGDLARADSPAFIATQDMPVSRVARNHLLLVLAVLGLIAATVALNHRFG